MGLKQFNLDLRVTIEALDSFPNVSNLRKGDSDGEIAFTYTPAAEHEAQLPPIDVQALSKDADSYPNHPGFMIFTSSETPKDLEKWLEETSSLTDGITIADAIKLICSMLATKLSTSNQSISQAPPYYGEESDVDLLSDDDDSFYEAEFDEIDIDPLLPGASASEHATEADDPESMIRLKRHLREAKQEGFCISIPPEEIRQSSFGIFSLSVRVCKLGIPEEALEAWGIEPTEYIVMLCKLPSTYPHVLDFQRLPPDQTRMNFKLGKCSSPRPNYKSMRHMFAGAEEPVMPTDKDEESTDSFIPLYMSLSLDALLNRFFPTLLRLRRSEGISWDEARELEYNLSLGHHSRDMVDHAQDVIVCQDRESSDESFEPEFLRHDYLSSNADELNIVLIAMQFGLQRLIKCTKYCLVCHRRAKGGFEAVKPFVCETELCLYQYLSLGFGQSIEHEIINNPYVVDFLVSFFYAAVIRSRLREFPRGLGLKCPSSAFTASASTPVSADAYFNTGLLRFESKDLHACRTIKTGHWLMLFVAGANTLDSQTPVMRTYREKHICYIESCIDTDFWFKVMHTFTSLDNIGQETPDNSVNQATQPTTDGVKVLIYKYGQDIDELEDAVRDQALCFMTSCIPPVQTMRQYLIEVPGRRLSSWKQIEGSALRLLNWIVSSNRSHIVQDSPDPGASAAEEQTQNSSLVRSADYRWMQFRFAQGSPEKEHIFFNELQKIPRSRTGRTYQTLFAWHGSPLSNWHSIIRTGLDFSNTLHGRAYGNGVYLARDFETSRAYSNRDTMKAWPSSALKVTSAISMCEIVNSPSQFVSTNPFFVVNRIDWIQCRYLFVQIQIRQPESSVSLSNEGLFPDRVQGEDYIEQDPAYQLTHGLQQRVNIPLSAIPKFRRRAFGQGQQNGTGSSIDHPIVLDDSDSNGSPNLNDSSSSESPEMSDDIDVLLASDDEGDDLQLVGTRKRRRTSTDSGLGETQRGPDDVTPFQPGHLDIDSLPKLAEPTWASSSPAALRALNGQIKDLQKTQSKTNLATLGWYIDFDKLNNLFHWFVELHSFDRDLPLAKDMASHGCSSIVLELRFGASFPISPPFVRVIRPRFLPFAQGGGGHVTIGGAICSELLTNSGWSPALSLEKVFLEVRLNLCERDPPARLERVHHISLGKMDYSMFEAVDAYRRAAVAHGWQIPSDLQMLQSMSNVSET
ncbi:uncharacterized protein FFB20_15342 [Fusarium fujikuroi]|uniref:UBC core domain-containing protein n=2 Tax=Fusarium fujikuroi TaxID=5127 RepID=S0E9M3_GIBF5|nr:uncharacterized protein FFUJ_08361 [Fusarium fujikuroi IMI 58289]QGI67305.1 hypothetical protein CEK27_011276 [Fusarium fujikuroi]QGI84536.1 hypothetical protein CEK25_011265 [Fusarium fujikuroi]QGI98189.1 hypothetical protein CEK26_011258 [Fusarium fujikuroi]CCT71554.1 uncharacterized protein FFUJ_08361 [Fusarium fujikuroi IMI 58289]SCO11571.1 uncharacterized protein FFE2_12364 [Fusarium fujikuroi]